MTNDAFHQQTYAYFLMEAQDLLQAIEQDLLSLREDRQPAKVHNLMRSAHTLKGAAASVGFQSIKTMAHNLEDVFKALYNPNVVIDTELETLLLVSHDCLRSPIIAAVTATDCPEADVLARANATFGQLKAKLGKHFDPNAGIPTSAELGFDITRSIFETGVSERLESLATALASGNAATVAQILQTQAEVFIGLAESLNLPGFGAIAKAVQAALAAHPDQPLAIAAAALIDFRQGQAAVLTGDRTQGGKPSVALKQLTQKSSLTRPKLTVDNSPVRPPETPPTLGLTSIVEVEPALQRSLPPIIDHALANSGTLPVSTLKSPSHVHRWVKLWHWIVDFLNQPLLSTHLQTPVHPHPWPSDLTTDFTTVDIVGTSQACDRQLNLNSSPTSVTSSLDIPSNRTNIRIPVPDYEVVAFKPRLAEPININIDINEANFTDFDQLDDSNSSVQDNDDLNFELAELAHGLAGLGELESIADSPLGEPSAGAEELIPTQLVEVPRQTAMAAQAQSLATDLWQDAAKGSVAVTKPPGPLGTSPVESPAKASDQAGQQPPKATPTKLRVDLAHLEALNYSISELLINQNRQALQGEQTQGWVKELTDRLRQHQQTMMYLREWSDRLLIAEVKPLPHQSKQPTPDFDALELDRHSEMHGLLQDALEEIVKLSQTVEGLDLTVRQSGQTLSKQSRLLMNARDDLMEVRMVPIGTVLNRLPRLLQQLVEVYGKQVELQLKGTQVLVDKIIADKIYDPLLHLIRNAFDHGIEAVESRIQQGKPAIGKITIYAYQQGNRTLIDIQDDGHGLDFPKICRRAYEAGLFISDQVDQFTKAELINVLFEPGFSTAAQVSDLSGRGVGLDVVKAQVQALKGIVTVHSEPTQGTTFSLQLPLTLMTARLLGCQVGKAIYGFLSDEIERVLLPQPYQIKSATGQMIFHWQQGEAECPVPVHALSNLITYGLALPTIAQYDLTAPVLNSNTHPLLLLRVADGLQGIQVDQIVGEQELVIRPISTAITPPTYIYGCSILADGRLMLVIDGAALVRQEYGQNSHKPLTPQPRSTEGKLDLSPTDRPAVKRVLVVDDSITIRQTLAESLKNEGYEVLQAQDGLDAIAQLQQQANIQLITCDVEMPRLNGFEFLMRYRQDAGLPQVPVVMLTSRTSEKHRQLALQLGATAYMTKPYINQDFVNEIAHLMSVK